MDTKRMLGGLLLGLAIAGAVVAAQDTPTVEVYKSPYCGCCGKWVEHMRKNGFDVVARDVDDVSAARKALGMPERYASCHTAKIGRYTVEGHVPAADIRRLLQEAPKAVGLAAPGMPQGSPGMETATPEAYETLLVLEGGDSRVFAKH